MNSHYTAFTTGFFNDNVFCPRCLSYIALGDIESHSNHHERTSLTNTILNFHEDIFPREAILHQRMRNRVMYDNPFSRLARLQTLYTLTLDNLQANEEGDAQYDFNMLIADILGDVDVGVSDINKVSQLVDETSSSYSKCDCHICLEPTTNPRKLVCNHEYCDSCISTWLEKNKTCPVCRKDLEELVALKNAEKIED